MTVAYTDPSGDNDANAVQDAAGNDAASFDPQTVTNTAEAPPSVESVALTSDPGADATYAIGDTVRATVTFTAAVDVNPTGNQPQLALDIGGTPEQAVYESGTGTTALVFAYEVADDDEDANGIEIGANKLTLNGGTIHKASSTTIDADLDYDAVAADSGHKVDGMRARPVEHRDLHRRHASHPHLQRDAVADDCHAPAHSRCRWRTRAAP